MLANMKKLCFILVLSLTTIHVKSLPADLMGIFAVSDGNAPTRSRPIAVESSQTTAGVGPTFNSNAFISKVRSIAIFTETSGSSEAKEPTNYNIALTVTKYSNKATALINIPTRTRSSNSSKTTAPTPTETSHSNEAIALTNLKSCETTKTSEATTSTDIITPTELIVPTDITSTYSIAPADITYHRLSTPTFTTTTPTIIVSNSPTLIPTVAESNSAMRTNSNNPFLMPTSNAAKPTATTFNNFSTVTEWISTGKTFTTSKPLTSIISSPTLVVSSGKSQSH
ncbi:5737_t:CDS:2 [Paraglomus occultum]|uniref:5737_t:CDS:1 n=1 Tax=Paraglomus occultum TaxID=144539 RepID=A0A9N9BKK6_9GLOM|nr:5737_t:CDS:2 [Paraglomus occultum]